MANIENLDVNSNVTKRTKQFLDGHQDGGEDCLVVICRLLANKFLPPKQHQPSVRVWFMKSPGEDLLRYLQDDTSYGAQAVVETVQFHLKGD